MLAPWPTKNDVVTVSLLCFTGFSVLSGATAVVMVYLPLTGVQVPIVIGLDDAPAASDPLWLPDNDATVVPLLSLTTMVSACEPVPDAMLPWFFTVSVNV